MKSKREFQHTFFALGLIILAGLAADLVLWPRDQLPAVASLPVTEFFSKEFLERAQSFRGLQSWLGISSLAALVGIPLLIALKWPRELVGLGEHPGRHRAIACAVVGAGVTIAALVGALPFELVAFLRSRHYGLSVQGLAGWVWDWFLSALLIVGAVALLALVVGALIRRFGRAWWAIFGVLLIVLAALFQAFSPVLIEPLFADFKPLPAGETRRDVERIAREAGVETGEIYLVDAAKRTNGVNAYVTGLGSTKRVVIYDTLIRDFSRGTRREVIAHEIGHAHYSDLTAGLVWFAFVAMVSLYAIDLLARVLAARRGVAMEMPAAIAMIAAAAMVAVALTQPSANAYSRRVEARADAFALQTSGDPDAAIALERRLTVRNIARPEPPALIQFFFGTHPTPMQRIGMAETVKREHAAANAAERQGR